jgi:hypothetical protein
MLPAGIDLWEIRAPEISRRSAGLFFARGQQDGTAAQKGGCPGCITALGASGFTSFVGQPILAAAAF